MVNDLRYLWFRDKAYLMKRPSIDRRDSKGDYTLKNCGYLELSENIGRSCRENPRRKKGSKCSEESKRKISEALKLYWQKKKYG